MNFTVGVMALFDNIGKKLMRMARLCLIAFPVIALLLFFLLLALSVPGSWLCLPVGLLLTLSAFPLYGFGQLVQDVHDIRTTSSTIPAPKDDLPTL